MPPIFASSSDNVPGQFADTDIILGIRGLSAVSQSYADFRANMRSGLATTQNISAAIATHTALANAHHTPPALSNVGFSLAGTQLSLVYDGSGSGDVTLPTSGGTTDGVVQGASLAASGSSVQLTLDRTIGSDVVSNALDLGFLGNNGVDSVSTDFDTTSRVLTTTIGRVGAADLSDTATIPGGTAGTSDGVVDSATFSANNALLTLVLGRTIGGNVVSNAFNIATMSDIFIPNLQLAFDSGSRVLSATIARGGGHSALTDTVTIPGGGGGTADGVIDSLALTLNGASQIVATAGRSIGSDIVAGPLALTVGAIPNLPGSKISGLGLAATGRTIALHTDGSENPIAEIDAAYVVPGTDPAVGQDFKRGAVSWGGALDDVDAGWFMALTDLTNVIKREIPTDRANWIRVSHEIHPNGSAPVAGRLNNIVVSTGQNAFLYANDPIALPAQVINAALTDPLAFSPANLESAVFAFQTPSHDHPPVDEIPANYIGDFIFLDHDYTEGADSPVTMTIGQGPSFRGWSDGRIFSGARFGSVDRSAAPLSAVAINTAGRISTLYLTNRAVADDINAVRIDGTFYDVSAAIAYGGNWRVTVTAGPMADVGDAPVMQLRRADGTLVWTDGAVAHFQHGIYFWNDDATPEAYQFYDTFQGVPVQNRGADLANRMTQLSIEPPLVISEDANNAGRYLLGAPASSLATYIRAHTVNDIQAGTNIVVSDNGQGTFTIAASGSISATDQVARDAAAAARLVATNLGLAINGQELSIARDGSGADMVTLPTSGGASVDFGNINANLLPNSDDSHSVGTAARTWHSLHVTNATVDGTINAATGQITALNVGDGGVSKSIREFVQDTVGALVTDSPSVTWTYNDGAGTLSAAAAGGSGTADGVINALGATLNNANLLTLTAGRSVGADVVGTVDLSPLAGGGGGGGGTPNVFIAPANARTSLTISTTFQNVVGFAAADVIKNQGGFTIGGTDTARTITIPADGTYNIIANVEALVTASLRRMTLIFRLRVTRNGANHAVRSYSSSYNRGINNDSTMSTVHLDSINDLEAGDVLHFEMGSQFNSAVFTVGGINSEIAIAQIEAGSGGGGGTADGVVNTLAATLSAANLLTLTAGRTIGGDVVGTVDLSSLAGGGTAVVNASTTARGIIELATQNEVTDPNPDSERAVTPATLAGYFGLLRSATAFNLSAAPNAADALLVPNRASVLNALRAIEQIPDPSGATDGQVAKISGGAWTIGDDETGGGGGGGGDITAVTAGVGLGGGGDTGAVTLNLDVNGLTALTDPLADIDEIAIYDISASAMRKLPALVLEDQIRIHRGQFMSNVAYRQGSVVETGAADSKLFWIASQNLSAGQPEPTLVDPHNWWLLATPNHFRRELSTTDSHNFIEGDWFRVGSRYFIADADLTGITGNDLLGGHANVVELSSPILDDPNNSIDASAQTVDHLVWRPSSQDLLKTVPHHATARTVTWVALPNDYDFGGGRTFKGTVDTISGGAPRPSVVGDVYFERQGGNFAVGVSGGRYSGYSPPDWLGTYSYENDAEARVTSVDQIAAFPLSGAYRPYRVSAFTAATPSSYYYQSIAGGGSAITSIVAGTGLSGGGNAGDVSLSISAANLLRLNAIDNIGLTLSGRAVGVVTDGSGADSVTIPQGDGFNPFAGSSIQLPTFADADRIPIWQSAAGGRPRYRSLTDLRNEYFSPNILDHNGTTIANAARSLQFTGTGITATDPDSDEDIVVTVNAFDVHDTVTQEATPANADRFIFSDEGASGDPMRYVELEELRSNIQQRESVTQAEYDALTPDADTLYLIEGAGAPTPMRFAMGTGAAGTGGTFADDDIITIGAYCDGLGVTSNTFASLTIRFGDLPTSNTSTHELLPQRSTNTADAIRVYRTGSALRWDPIFTPSGENNYIYVVNHGSI